jgi:hypothetical protein
MHVLGSLGSISTRPATGRNSGLPKHTGYMTWCSPGRSAGPSSTAISISHAQIGSLRFARRAPSLRQLRTRVKPAAGSGSATFLSKGLPIRERVDRRAGGD